MAIDWDINDTVVPKINAVDLNPFNDWPDGHLRLVYTAADEEVKKHSSGWAMRNTNNHNVNILKKSCLGVFLCSLHCTPPIGNKIHIRPAICDKARKKQRGKACPNGACTGRLYIQPCRGHCGYPVTHFWRKSGGMVYFQAKGTHDHPRPEPKGSNQSKQLYTKRKTNSLDLLKRKSAVSNKLSALRMKAPQKSSKPQTSLALNTDYAVKDSFANNVQSWTPTTCETSHQYNQRIYASQQDLNASYASSNGSSTYYAQESSPQSAGDIFHFGASDELIRPEDIFQIDQPIRSTPNTYASSNYSNSMSPSSVSRSPPATFTELESTNYAANTYPYPSSYFGHTTNNASKPSWPIKCEALNDSSLTSISQQFNENYLSIQQLQQNNIVGSSVDANSTYYANGDFFDHCEQIAGVNGAEQDPTQFYAASGFDMDYEMMAQQQHGAGTALATNNEWTTIDGQSYGNYGCNGVQTTNNLFEHFQQSQYLTA